MTVSEATLHTCSRCNETLSMVVNGKTTTLLNNNFIEIRFLFSGGNEETARINMETLMGFTIGNNSLEVCDDCFKLIMDAGKVLKDVINGVQRDFDDTPTLLTCQDDKLIT